MIISASRRTDIPAFYSEWFFNRLQEGFLLVRNPMNFNQVSRVNLSTDVVDGIVFWSKNPAPMLDRLHLLDDYPFYFQFTLNPYGKDIEPKVPAKNEVVDTFKQLSEQIGPDRVLWRYDPILVSKTYSAEYHLRAFEGMAKELALFTRKVAFSFMVTKYREVQRNAQQMQVHNLTADEQLELCGKLSEIARTYGLSMEACAEGLDVEKVGISRACCIDGKQLEKVIGQELSTEKDKNQRLGCNCISSIDIGTYNTCRNGCLYCYANYSSFDVARNCAAHDPRSPLLFGAIGEHDRISERKMFSLCRGGLKNQLSLAM